MALLAIASATLITCAGVLGLAAAFTYGTTLIVLTCTAVGLGLTASAISIYSWIRKRQINKQIEALKLEVEPTQEVIQHIALDLHQMSKEEQQWLAEQTGVKIHDLEVEPQYFFEKHFSILFKEK